MFALALTPTVAARLPHGCQGVPGVLEKVSLTRGQSDFTYTILSACYKVSIDVSLKTQKEVFPLLFLA